MLVFAVILGKSVWKTRVFRCVTPARPYSITLLALSNGDNEAYVGVIVVVGATRHFDHFISEFYVLCIHLDVLWRRHRDELERLLTAKRLVRPFLHRPDALYGRDAIVGDENPPDHALPALFLDVLLDTAEHFPLRR